jgi:alcohol dehydrogenase class IV
MFDFYFNTRIKFGAGSSNVLKDILAAESWRNIGIVVDQNLADNDTVRKLISEIEKAADKVVVSRCTVSEPTYEYLEVIRKDFTSPEIQVIIGIGGGSAIDTAKAMAVLVHNKKPALQYRGFNMMTEKVLPIIAVPTTAGTGSEITPNASFVDAAAKKKLGINGESVRPRYAFLDPTLTLSCPLKPTISAAVDSIVHAVEAYVAKKSNPMAKLFAAEGIKKVFYALPRVAGNLQDIQQREEVMLGAFMAGVALMNSGTGPAAALSYPLGVHFKVPHGIGGGIFLPKVIRHNIDRGYYGYAELHDAVHAARPLNLSDEKKSRLFLDEMEKLWQDLSIPADVTTFGLKADFLDQFVKETMELKGALDQNPVVFDEKSILETLAVLKATK